MVEQLQLNLNQDSLATVVYDSVTMRLNYYTVCSMGREGSFGSALEAPANADYPPEASKDDSGQFKTQY